MKIVVTILSVLVVCTAVGWLGLPEKPRSFAAYPAQTGALLTLAAGVRRPDSGLF
jgi:hypothetical protein